MSGPFIILRLYNCTLILLHGYAILHRRLIRRFHARLQVMHHYFDSCLVIWGQSRLVIALGAHRHSWVRLSNRQTCHWIIYNWNLIIKHRFISGQSTGVCGDVASLSSSGDADGRLIANFVMKDVIRILFQISVMWSDINIDGSDFWISLFHIDFK